MAGSVTAGQRYTRGHPCPICGGYEQEPRHRGKRCSGFISGGGKYARCSREDFAGSLPLDEKTRAYVHLLRGDCDCGVRHGDPDEPRKPRGHIVAEYDYADESGVVLFQVVRLEPKGFRQRHADENGRWVNNLRGVRRVLYHLPELREADPAAPVFICEGEKDVDRVRGLGLVATCNPQGAGNWRADYSPHLAGRHVVILPDRDDAGRVHAQQVATSLHGTAASVKVLELPGSGKDASDWIVAGGTAEALKTLATASAEWAPPPERPCAVGGRRTQTASVNRDDYPCGLDLDTRVEHGLPWCCDVPGTEGLHPLQRAMVGMVEQARLMDPTHPYAKATDQALAAQFGLERRSAVRLRPEVVRLEWIRHRTLYVEWQGKRYGAGGLYQPGARLLPAESRARVESHGAEAPPIMESHGVTAADPGGRAADVTPQCDSVYGDSPEGAQPPDLALPVVPETTGGASEAGETDSSTGGAPLARSRRRRHRCTWAQLGLPFGPDDGGAA